MSCLKLLLLLVLFGYFLVLAQGQDANEDGDENQQVSSYSGNNWLSYENNQPSYGNNQIKNANNDNLSPVGQTGNGNTGVIGGDGEKEVKQREKPYKRKKKKCKDGRSRKGKCKKKRKKWGRRRGKKYKKYRKWG